MSKPLLEIAKDSLNKSLSSTRSIPSQAFALDSIAASLLSIARHLEASKEETPVKLLTENDVELTIRRLLDNIKDSPKKGKK